MMEPIRRPNHLIGFYFSILLILLVCVSATPLLIRHGIALTSRLVIEEDMVETAMILSLFGVSFLILMRFMRQLQAYQAAVNKAVIEKSSLVERLTDAFQYIGRVNVEIHEIESALCGIAFYPQSRKEFRRLLDQLALKALTIAAAPWLVVRMIDRQSGQTANEHSVWKEGGDVPAHTLGNRDILDGNRHDGLQTIGPRQQNLDLLTVIILPEPTLSKEKIILLSAILNQIEMLFLLFRAGCIKPQHACEQAKEKEIVDDSNY